MHCQATETQSPLKRESAVSEDLLTKGRSVDAERYAPLQLIHLAWITFKLSRHDFPPPPRTFLSHDPQ